MTDTLAHAPVRALTPDDLVTTSATLQTYGFFASPGSGQAMVDLAPYLVGNLTLAMERDGESIAEIAAIPMRQNVRGRIVDMAGVTAGATRPQDRRRGHASRLLRDLQGAMIERGCAVSCLYPFRPSVWARSGYVGLPKNRTTTFAPRGLAPLLHFDPPGEVTVRRIGAGYDDYRAAQRFMLDTHHGFAMFPDFRAVRLRDADDQWLATVRTGGEVTGALLYRITGFDAELAVSALFARDRMSRAALLRHLALHVDQVARVVLPLAPDDQPELWATDIETRTDATVALPGTPAAMARVLSLDGLDGMEVGPGRVTVRVVGDPFVGGDHTLDGSTGRLEVSPGGGEPGATVTIAGLSGLVYGVFDPDDVVIRGLGTMTAPATVALRTLFPRRAPNLSVAF